jgi:hypothetical protein
MYFVAPLILVLKQNECGGGWAGLGLDARWLPVKQHFNSANAF